MLFPSQLLPQTRARSTYQVRIRSIISHCRILDVVIADALLFQAMTYQYLVLAQYLRRPDTPFGDEHWALLALSNPLSATMYHLMGQTGDYGYETRAVSSYPNSKTLCGAYLAGVIPTDKLAWLETTIKAVAIPKHQPHEQFNCQIWSIQVLKHLAQCAIIEQKTKAAGVVIRDVSTQVIKKVLRDEYERWQVADPTLWERLTWPPSLVNWET